MTSARRGVGEFLRLVGGECLPGCVVVAGLGRAGEALTLREVFPLAKLVGVDPLAKFTRAARRRGRFDRVFGAALWDRDEPVKIWTDYGESESSTAFAMLEPLAGAGHVVANGWRLGTLRRRCRHLWRAPVLLWLDAEGAEAKIIGGGGRALADVAWLNVEVCVAGGRLAPDLVEVAALLKSRGFAMVGFHSASASGRTLDAVFVREAIAATIRLQICRESAKRKAKRAKAAIERSLLGGLASATEDI